MTFWQADFYKVDRTISNGDEVYWQLLICDRAGQILLEQSCPQSEVSSQWLTQQLEPLLAPAKPEGIEIFRPQSFNLFKQTGEQLGLNIIATRRVIALKTRLQERYGEESVKLELPPPQPLPENLWGEQWRFA
ncbi:MAG: Tab2/Atab2 family RNA-binding protein, partial [Microcystaceae cyanobacterium]